MKKLLLVVLSLWSFAGLAQTTTTKIAEIKPKAGVAGSTYYVQYERNWNDFPATTTGYNSLTTAIASGQLRLVVSGSGCIIPVGTKPPAFPPTCVTQPTTNTSIVTIPAVSLQLTASNGAGTGADIGGGYYGPYGDATQYRTHTVTAPITAANYDLAIHYQTNTQTTGKGNIVVNGSTSVEFDLEGAEGGKRTVHRLLALTSGSNTIRLEGKSGTPFFYDNIVLTRAASTTVVTTTTPGSTTTTDPGSTTTNPGSSTVVDGEFIAGAFDFADFPSASIPSDFRPSLETDKLKVTLDLKEGTKPNNGLAGGIRYFTDKMSGNNTISMPVFAVHNGDDYGFPLGTTDDGRGINECLYRLSPKPWNIGGFSLGIGDNVNESGDVSEHPSRLIAFRRTDSMLETVIEPNQWDGDGLRTGDVFKKWIKVSGNEMRVWYESSFSRTDATGANERQESKFQEAPCDYLNGNYSDIYFYDGDTPYQNGSVRKFRLDDNSGMTPGAQFLTENWMAGCDPNTGRCQGIIMETPAGQTGQFQSKGSYNAEGSMLSSTYIAYYPFQLLDANIKFRHSVIFVIGTLDEIRAKAYQYTSWKRTLEYRFNKSGRQNWGGRWFDDGGYKDSRSTWGPIRWTSNEGEIVTPAVALDGNIKKHYMRYKYTSQTRLNVNMVARWTRARQAAGYSNGTPLWDLRFPEGAAVGDDYAKTFSLIADGQWHVVTIDFSDRPQWRQIITQLRLTNDGASAVGESLEVDWISANPNGPTN